PVRDKETIDMELQLKDLEALEKLRDKNVRTAKSGDKEGQKILAICEKYIAHLEAGNSARSVDASEDELEVIETLQLLTAKPVMYMCNVDEESVKTGNKHVSAVKEAVKNEDAEVLLIATAIEAEIAELEDVEERLMFLEELGLEKPGVHYLIQSTYKLLNLKTYFTAGLKEVRAWTITEGTKAPQAAAVIHTDFEKGFIRAEVMAYNDFVTLGSEQACKDNGKLAIEGKDYLVKDGDIMNFRFNV
ncbi:MAG: redox-regulated ATPase YchF, partial [Flavobacteriales bacterium]|nr:redox-regulated ATPase YchF [Flavobacteriales bacterium]